MCSLNMKIIYGINKIKKFKRPVVAMGVFDGVHRGHKEILKATVAQARKIKGTSIAVTFWPHPQKEESLYSLEYRLRFIAELGIDVCIVINFSRHFAKIKARDFVKDILVDKICAGHIYVGRNFRFGKNIKGDFALLNNLGKIYGFKARGFKIIKAQGKPISSTLIRNLIRRGKIKEAQRLLGRPVSILGTVIKGAALGRILGFPTANIDPHHEVIPAAGIYAARIILGHNKLKGACYIGRRPTISPQQKKINVEVHIFKFNKNIYGKCLEIQFVKRIRLDKRFANLASLSKQIKKDVSTVKKILN